MKQIDNDCFETLYYFRSLSFLESFVHEAAYGRNTFQGHPTSRLGSQSPSAEITSTFTHLLGAKSAKSSSNNRPPIMDYFATLFRLSL